MLTGTTVDVDAEAGPPQALLDRFYWRLVDSSLFVVDLNQLKLTILNASAGVLWLSLIDQIRTRDQLTDILSEASGADSGDVTPDVGAMVAEWTDLGWITGSAKGSLTISSQTTEPRPPRYRAVTREKLDRVVSASGDEWRMDCNLIGKSVSIRFLCDPGLEGSVLSRRTGSFLNGIPRSDQTAESAIHCFVTSDGIFLRLNDTCVHALDAPDGMSRLILWAFYLGYGADNFLGTFHAAAVGNEKGAILMPGISGRGKSTLTAFLTANGWIYGGDDIIGLGHPTTDDPRCLVLPFCSALSVKEGSVPVLEPLYPGLGSLPEIDYDIKSARFLGIPQEKQMGADPTPRRIRAIVFPHFDKAAPPAEISPLTSRDALLQLAGVGYRTGERMDPMLLSSFLDFLEATPKFKLDFSDLASAERALKELS